MILTKKIDDLGRIVIPSDLREYLNIQKHDYIDLQLLDNNILLMRKHDVSLNYEKIIKYLLISLKGSEYSNYFITSQQVEEFKELITKFINENYIMEQIY